MIRSRSSNYFLLITFFICISNLVFSQIKQKSLIENDSIELLQQSFVNDHLYGTLVDSESKYPIPFANIVIEANNRQITGTTSSLNGFYELYIPDTLNEFKVIITYVGYHSKEILILRNQTEINENNSKDDTEINDN